MNLNIMVFNLMIINIVDVIVFMSSIIEQRVIKIIITVHNYTTPEQLGYQNNNYNS